MTRSLLRVGMLAAAAFLPAASASAQIDLSGDWALLIHEDQHWRGAGAEIGEYTGLPINAAGRMRARSWDPSLHTLPERQCIPLPADDFTDFGNMRIWKEVDPATQRVIAWHQYTEWQAQERVIWMDGRPHPSPYAPHTWAGFSTGRWERNQLTITTTHLKAAAYERAGTHRSDRGTLTEHWMRHGNYLTVMVIIRDPVYLAEPLVRTRQYVLDPNQRMRGYSCNPAQEIAGRPEGYVPHYLPGKNPYLLSATRRFGVPEIALGGGPETMYPEFQARLRAPAAAAPARPDPPGTTAAASASPPPAPDPASVEITAVPVQGSVHLLVGAGGNTVLQVGEHAAFVVDTQLPQMSGALLAAIRRITDKPIRYVFNTHAHSDHTGGNADLARAGSTPGLQQEDPITGDVSSRAEVLAHENVLKRMSGAAGAGAPPFAAWPTETYATSDYRLYNGEGIEILHQPSAHTDGDSIVFFRRSDVIAAGDIFSQLTYPVIDTASGGSLAGILAGLNRLIKLSIPRDKQEGGTYIVPGNGRISDQADVVEYRDMVTIIRDRIADLIQQGMTVEQVKAAQPTFDYDARFGAPTAFWTKERFIETVYAELRARKTE